MGDIFISLVFVENPPRWYIACLPSDRTKLESLLKASGFTVYPLRWSQSPKNPLIGKDEIVAVRDGEKFERAEAVRAELVEICSQVGRVTNPTGTKGGALDSGDHWSI